MFDLCLLKLKLLGLRSYQLLSQTFMEEVENGEGKLEMSFATLSSELRLLPLYLSLSLFGCFFEF